MNKYFFLMFFFLAYGPASYATSPKPKENGDSLVTLKKRVISLKSSVRSLRIELTKVKTKLERLKVALKELNDVIKGLSVTGLRGNQSTGLMGAKLSAKGFIESSSNMYGVFCYHVKILNQNAAGPLGNDRWKYGFVKLRPDYACGFHSLKNILFLTRMALLGVSEEDCNALISIDTFLHLFEAAPPSESKPTAQPLAERVKKIAAGWKKQTKQKSLAWKILHTKKGEKVASIPAPARRELWKERLVPRESKQHSWYFLWQAYRSGHPLLRQIVGSSGLDDPQTMAYELENLKEKIRNNEALAPAGAQNFIARVSVIQYLQLGDYTDTTLNDAVKLVTLAKQLRDQDSFVASFIVAYNFKSWRYATAMQAKYSWFGKEGRHWNAVLINKYGGIIEAFIADAAHNGRIGREQRLLHALLPWLTNPQATVCVYFAAIQSGGVKKDETDEKVRLTPLQINAFKTKINALYPGTLS